MEYWMGIDLGGTKIRAGAVDRNGTVAALRESYTKDAADADMLREQIIAMGSRIMEEYPIQGAGMCFPGVIMADKTLQHATNLPGECWPRSSSPPLSMCGISLYLWKTMQMQRHLVNISTAAKGMWNPCIT